MSERKRAKTVAEGWVPRRHGIASSYFRGCRCEACTAANTESQRRSNLRGTGSRRNQDQRYAERVEIDGRMVHPSPYGGHGTLAAYNSCGCRCVPCVAAKREQRAAYSARRRAES